MTAIGVVRGQMQFTGRSVSLIVPYITSGKLHYKYLSFLVLSMSGLICSDAQAVTLHKAYYNCMKQASKWSYCKYTHNGQYILEWLQKKLIYQLFLLYRQKYKPKCHIWKAERSRHSIVNYLLNFAL